jgi:hypothetical protein
MLTSELFQDIGADIGAVFRDLEAKGVDMDKALALSQPTLQKLWEAQQKYGVVTDETTQKILKQAEEQGLVGDHMKDVNERILDVLVLIADVLGADIPDALRGIKPVAEKTASDFEKVFGKMKVPEVQVPIRFTSKGASVEFEGGGRFHVPGFQHGGIVKAPTVALVGEAGPEAVIPLSNLNNVMNKTGALSIYVAIDPKSKDVRILSEEERRQIQNWMFSGRLQVPTRAVSSRSR